MNIYTIYKAENKINNKIYIGFDSNWPHRKNCHKCNYKNKESKFYRAIRKYGWENFEWSIIYQSKCKDHTKNVMENYFICENNSFKDGYNSTLGGDGTFGIKRKGQKVPYNHNGWIGRKHTEKTKQIMSQNMRVSKPNAKQSGSNNNNAKKIQTPFGIFGSIKEASEKIQLPYNKVWKLLQKSDKWIYLF